MNSKIIGSLHIEKGGKNLLGKNILLDGTSYSVDLNTPVQIVTWAPTQVALDGILGANHGLARLIVKDVWGELVFQPDTDKLLSIAKNKGVITRSQFHALLDLYELSNGIYLSARKINETITLPEFQVVTAHNGAIAKLEDDTHIMLARCHLRGGRSIFIKATSPDGIHDWMVDPLPALLPADSTMDLFYSGTDRQEIELAEAGGVEDGRLTEIIDDSGKKMYMLTYTGYSIKGMPWQSLAISEDLKSFTRMGPILREKARNTVLFQPDKDGILYGLTRISTGENNRASYKEIRAFRSRGHWRNNQWELLENPVRTASPGPNSTSEKIGPGAPLIRLDDGSYLAIEHGARRTVEGMPYVLTVSRYQLDTSKPDDPIHVEHSEIPILFPQKDNGASGFDYVRNVVFTTAAIKDPGGVIRLYVASNDSVMQLALTHEDILLGLIKKYPSDPNSGEPAYELRKNIPPKPY